MVTFNGDTYSGKKAAGFYSDLMLFDGFKSTLTVLPNTLPGQKLAKMSLSGALQSFSCSFSNSVNTTIDVKTVYPGKFKINYEECVETFWDSYLAEELKGTEAFAGSFVEYMLEQLKSDVTSDLDDLVINGNASADDTIDGFLTQWAADSSVIDVTGTTITESNVLAELKKVYEAIPLPVRENVTIFVSAHIADAYRFALTTVNPALMAVNDANFAMAYMGKKLEVVKHLPANVMFACDRANLVVLTQILNEITDLKVLNMTETSGEPKMRIVGAFTYGVSYYKGNEIVFYH